MLNDNGGMFVIIIEDRIQNIVARSRVDTANRLIKQIKLGFTLMTKIN